VDLNRALNGGEECCGYARVQIVSKSAKEVLLTFGSDDGIKVWLNGAVVHTKNVARSFTLDEDQVRVVLKQGENTLLIKVTQGGGDWTASCGVKSPDGGPAAAVEFKGR
jgi:hypothetical protein